MLIFCCKTPATQTPCSKSSLAKTKALPSTLACCLGNRILICGICCQGLAVGLWRSGCAQCKADGPAKTLKQDGCHQPDNPPILLPVVGGTLWPVLSTPCLKMDGADHHPVSNGATLFCCRAYLPLCIFAEGPEPGHHQQKGVVLAFSTVPHTGSNCKCCGGICSPSPELAIQATAKSQSQLDSPILRLSMAAQQFGAISPS